MSKINPRVNCHFQTPYAKNTVLEEKKETSSRSSIFSTRRRGCLTSQQRFGILEVIPAESTGQSAAEEDAQGGKYAFYLFHGSMIYRKNSKTQCTALLTKLHP